MFTFFYNPLTDYKSLCVWKFLKYFAEIFVSLFVRRTENLVVDREERGECGIRLQPLDAFRLEVFTRPN